MIAGPTSFAPIIEMAITVVEQSNGQYHVLVIIADGQVFNFLKPFWKKFVSVKLEGIIIIIIIFPFLSFPLFEGTS